MLSSRFSSRDSEPFPDSFIRCHPISVRFSIDENGILTVSARKFITPVEFNSVCIKIIMN